MREEKRDQCLDVSSLRSVHHGYRTQANQTMSPRWVKCPTEHTPLDMWGVRGPPLSCHDPTSPISHFLCGCGCFPRVSQRPEFRTLGSIWRFPFPQSLIQQIGRVLGLTFLSYSCRGKGRVKLAKVLLILTFPFCLLINLVLRICSMPLAPAQLLYWTVLAVASE